MKGKNGSRFDLDALRARAGDKVFARGEAYHRDGLVEILAIEPRRILAQVAGTEDYRTVLTGRGDAFDGDCSCPAVEDWGFCKHMVATALTANAAAPEAEAEGAGALTRIREHLKAKGVDALVDMIVGLAERDAGLFGRLELAAVAVQADDKLLATRLRKAIDRSTGTHGFIGYGEAAGWASGVAEVLEQLAGLASDPRGALALPLVERAISRIEEAMGGIDDSNGHCGSLLEQARDIHLYACLAARPEPVELARDLFAREIEGDYDTFSNAAEIYAEVLGEAGLAEYRRLASEAWAALPPSAGIASAADRFSLARFRLEPILDFFAEREGDVEARIALRGKDLSSPSRYLRLAEFCLAQGREDEALRRAEEGLWVFEDAPDQRLVVFVAERLVKAGREHDAEARLARCFEKKPSLELYNRLRQLGGVDARRKALSFLEARLGAEKPNRWHAPAELLIRILMQEKMFDAAWATLRRHGASPGVKESLAAASEATHAREALDVYAGRVEELAGIGGNAYETAASLVGRMATLRDASEQAAYVAALKERHKRKRNFMKLLD